MRHAYEVLPVHEPGSSFLRVRLSKSPPASHFNVSLPGRGWWSTGSAHGLPAEEMREKWSDARSSVFSVMLLCQILSSNKVVILEYFKLVEKRRCWRVLASPVFPGVHLSVSM